MVLRPRALGDVLDLAVPFCLAARRPLGKLALVVLGPVALVAAALRLKAGWAWWQVWLLVLPVSFLLQGAFTVACGEALFADPRELRARRVLAHIGRRSAAYLGMFLLRFTVMAALGSSLLAVPLVPGFMFMGESLLLERVGAATALSRSRALSRHRGGFCFWLWVCTALLPAVAAMAADLVGDAVVNIVLQLGRPLGSLWTDGGSAFAVAGALLAVPVAAAARFLGYIDLRTRKEGWDIQLRFAALADEDAERRRAA
jgi:hypothetical protein